MGNRIAKGTLIICGGLALAIVGFAIRPSDNSIPGGTRNSNRLIVLGVALSIAGVVFLFRKDRVAGPDREEYRRWSVMMRLYALAAVSCGGSVFLVAYGMSNPDYRWLSLVLAVGTLVLGAYSYVVARRYSG